MKQFWTHYTDRWTCVASNIHISLFFILIINERIITGCSYLLHTFISWQKHFLNESLTMILQVVPEIFSSDISNYSRKFQWAFWLGNRGHLVVWLRHWGCRRPQTHCLLQQWEIVIFLCHIVYVLISHCASYYVTYDTLWALLCHIRHILCVIMSHMTHWVWHMYHTDVSLMCGMAFTVTTT